MNPRQTEPRSMTAFEWGLLVLLSVLWGGSFFFNGIAIRELPPFTIVVCRVALAALILYAAMRAQGLRVPTERGIWAAFFGMGFLNNLVPFSLIVWGQLHIASGVASILNATTPLMTVIVAHFLTRDEKMTGGKLVGVVIGLAGVAAMIGSGAWRALGQDVLAQLAILAAALSYAFAGVFGKRFRRYGIAPVTTAAGQVTAASVLLLPVVLIVDRPWTLPMPGAATLLSLVGIAALSTALAYIIYFRLLAAAGATNLLLVTFLIPVSAILLGIWFLGEALAVRHVAGMAMIGLGLAAIDGRLLRVFRRARAPAKQEFRETVEKASDA